MIVYIFASKYCSFLAKKTLKLEVSQTRAILGSGVVKLVLTETLVQRWPLSRRPTDSVCVNIGATYKYKDSVVWSQCLLLVQQRFPTQIWQPAGPFSWLLPLCSVSRRSVRPTSYYLTKNISLQLKIYGT
jgi:hypothetical protein